MDQEIDLSELWHTINESVDWLLGGIFALLALNALFMLYFAWTVVSEPNFFDKYSLTESDRFVAKAKSLEEVPSLEELEVEPPEVDSRLPQRYVDLKETKIFMPLGNRQLQSETTLAKSGKKQRQLPKIEGYEIVGRIAGGGGGSVSVLKRTEDGRTFIAKEGERLNKQSDIKVENVTDTMVRLTQPQHRPTVFQFSTDEIKEGIRKYRENISLH